MNKKTEDIFNGLLNFEAPRFETIPNFDLYMDQVILYINEVLEPLNFETDTKTITSSMVNNYVKNSIVKPPVKKHYKTYHVVYLFVVCILKRCYSLREIQQLIQVYSNIEDKGTFSRDFNKFMYVFEATLKEVIQTGVCTQQFFESPSEEQQLMINVILTIVNKIYAEYKLLCFEEAKKIPIEK
jgi:hypothetical protein